MTDEQGELRLRQWIETTLQGTVEAWERQERWRDAWFATVRVGERRLPIYVRGDRNEAFPPRGLAVEAAVLTQLGRDGLPVPHIYGICPDPHAIVMEQAPGRACLQNAKDEVERVAVLEHLGELTARLHAVDVAPYVAAGVPMPGERADALLPYFRDCETIYLKHRRAADPRVSFLSRWLYRNLPPMPARLHLSQADAGQFLFENGRVTALLDFELACLCEPALDLAALRQRAVAEPMGDLRPFFRRYLECSDQTVSAEAIQYHTVAWHAGTCALMAGVMHQPKPGTDLPEYLSWYLGCLMAALEGLGERCGWPLPAPEAAPVEAPSRWSGPSFGLLRTHFDSRQDYADQCHGRVAVFLERVDRFGAWAEAGYLQEVERLTGRKPSSSAQADQWMDTFIAEAGPTHDRALFECFHRWAQRQMRLIEGLFRMPLNAKQQAVDELLGVLGG